MTSVLARFGQQVESLLPSRTLWSSGKRKRGEWLCRECRRGRALNQYREYSEDALAGPTAQYLFQPAESTKAEDDRKGSSKRAKWHGQARTQLFNSVSRSQPWGLGVESDDVSRAQEGEGEAKALLSHKRRETPERRDLHPDSDQARTALWEESEVLEDEEEEDSAVRHRPNDDFDTGVSSHDTSLLNVDYASQLFPAVSNCESDMVLRCLLAAARSNDLDFVRKIPRQTFIQIIELIQPSHFMEKLASTHLEISEAVASSLRLTPLHKVAWQHSNLLQELVGIRQASGIELGLAEYKLLLRTARDLRTKPWARRLWQSLHNAGLTPDTDCYNYYMGAVVWNGAFHASTRQKVRVIPFHLLSRKVSRPGKPFANYRVDGATGVKFQTTQIFTEMLKNGALANEESFRLVMTAAAREGDVATVKTVLLRAWDVDVDALLASKDETTVQPKPLSEQSPLYPTSKLLFTIADTFGMNNDIPTALRVVDFVARRFNLEIGIDTWRQLFEWTFVLSAHRTGINTRNDGSNTGTLPKQSMLGLWETMTGEPYSIRPTMGMYNLMIKNLCSRTWPDKMLERMEEGRQLYIESQRRARTAFDALKHEVDAKRRIPDYAPGTPLENFRREWEYLDLLRKRDVFWLKRWLRLLLSTMRSWTRVDTSSEWILRKIPSLLHEWRAFAPTVVEYETEGGRLRFPIRDRQSIRLSRQREMKNFSAQKGVMDQTRLFLGDEWVVGRELSKKTWSEGKTSR